MDFLWIFGCCINYSLPPHPCTVVHALLKKNRHNFANSLSSCVHWEWSPALLPCLTPSPVQEKTKIKKKLNWERYLLQCTLYVHRKVHLGFFKKFYLIYFLFCKIFLTLPWLASAKSLNLPPPPPSRNQLAIGPMDFAKIITVTSISEIQNS